jgi:hypothetical protein
MMTGEHGLRRRRRKQFAPAAVNEEQAHRDSAEQCGSIFGSGHRHPQATE